MKLSKTSWLILTIGIFIIIFSSLGMARSQQVHERNQLNEELSLAMWRLDEFQFEELSSRQEELEEQLSDVMAEFEAAKAVLSQPTGSIATSDTLFDIAKVCRVEVTEISSSDMVREDLEGITCFILPLTARVEGEIPNLIRFITKLNTDFSTGIVKSVEINIPEVTEDPGETGEESAEGQSGEEEPEVEEPSATIRLVLYTYRGD